MRGRNHPPMTSCGVRRQRGRLCRWTAAIAKASACWPDCRFSRASDIHSRITARRTFILAILYFLSRRARRTIGRRTQGSALRRLLKRMNQQSPRRKRAAAFVHHALLNNEAARFQRRAKALVYCGLLSVDPNHQHRAVAKEIHQPVQRRLKRPKPASSPIDERDIVLTSRTATVARRRSVRKAAPMQLQHQLHALGAGYDDAVLRRAASKRDHRFNNSVARGNLKKGHFTSPVLVRSRLFRRPHPGKNRPPSGRTSFGPHYFVRIAGWFIVVRERLYRDGYVAGGTYSFERVASSVVYEPHKLRVAPRRWGCVAVEPVVVANADVATGLSAGRYLFRS
jgi:hypothetical protein